MNPTEAILMSAEQGWDEVDESLVVFVVESAVSAYKAAVARTEDHWIFCACPECEWLEPPRPEEKWHGTMNGYGYHKCRCMRCRKAVRNYTRTKKGTR